MARASTRKHALSTNQKIAIAVGATAAVVLIGSAVLAKPNPPKVDFSTRNLAALNAVVNAMIADPNLQSGPLNAFADKLAYYGLQEQEQRMRARAKVAVQTVDKTVPYHGF